jgi:hypothetical protein
MIETNVLDIVIDTEKEELTIIDAESKITKFEALRVNNYDIEKYTHVNIRETTSGNWLMEITVEDLRDYTYLISSNVLNSEQVAKIKTIFT